MSTGPAQKPDFGGASDAQLAKIGKQNIRTPDLNISSLARAELSKRRKAARKEFLQKFEKQREETVALLQATPGRSATFMGSGSNNPFRL